MLSEKRNIMLARISRLAKKHGPFVRFFPGGSEERHEETPIEDPDKPKDVDDGSALESAIKGSEKATKTADEQRAIDDARKNEQQVEQERANAERAREEARQAQTDLEASQTANTKLQEKLEAAEVAAAEAGITDVELKEDDYKDAPSDLAMVKAINTLKTKLEASNKRSAALEKKAKGYEQQAQNDQAKAARNAAYDEILTDLDDEYGADVRNEALKIWQEKVKAGEIPKGKPAQATRIMEKCYKQAKAAKDEATKKAKDKSPSLDTGSGGGSGPNLTKTEIKEGSLDDVAEQVGQTEFGKRKA